MGMVLTCWLVGRGGGGDLYILSDSLSSMCSVWNELVLVGVVIVGVNVADLVGEKGSDGTSDGAVHIMHMSLLSLSSAEFVMGA